MKVDIGSLIGGVVSAAVNRSLDKGADNINTAMKPSDVPKVAPGVEAAVKNAVSKEVQPIIDHLTNNEAHWYQKRSFWSAIVSIGGVVLLPIAAKFGLEGYLAPENHEMAVDALTKLSGALAAYLAYRAGTATKPLGE